MEEEIEEILTKKWHKFLGRDNDIALGSLYTEGFEGKYFEQYGVKNNIKNFLTLSGGDLYDVSEEMISIENEIGKDLEGKSVSITENCKKIFSRLEKFIEQTPKEHDSLHATDLIKEYNNYLDHFLPLVPYSFVVSSVLEKLLKAELEKQLTSERVVDPATFLTKIIISDKKNGIILEQEDRRKLLDLTGDAQTEAIQRHAHEYSWISIFRPTDLLLSEEGISESLAEIKKESDGQTTEETVPEGINKTFVAILKEHVWLRTYRKELMSKTFVAVRPLYQKIAEVLGISLTDLSYLASWEIPELLSGNIKMTEINLVERSKEFTIVLLDDKKFVLDKKITIAKDNNESTEELRGGVAFKGIAKGVVRIVKTRDDLLNFNTGEILVAPSLAVWMTDLAFKASGLVIEEGGILSHAAIIAREAMVPALIGVKNATQILKTGDIVEVDADNGVVRIIK